MAREGQSDRHRNGEYNDKKKRGCSVHDDQASRSAAKFPQGRETSREQPTVVRAVDW